MDAHEQAIFAEAVLFSGYFTIIVSLICIVGWFCTPAKEDTHG